MTNPDNIVRVRARNGGRASVYEANGWAQAYTSGLLEGNGVTQNTSADMNVLVGGSATKPDVVLAINPADYRIGLDLVGQQAIAITAPASNSRISAIVAYTDDLSLATSEDTVTGSPSSCGLIVVNGTASASPSEPTDNQIRTAITADGATGSQAAYCVIATILVASNTTTITDSLITNKVAKLAGTGVVSSSNIDFTTLSPCIAVASGTTSNPPTAKLTAPANGCIVVEATTGDNWGYEGNTVYFSISTPSGLQSIFSQSAIWSGGNTLGRQGIARAVFTGAVKGTEYSFGINRESGSFGQTCPLNMTATWFPN